MKKFLLKIMEKFFALILIEFVLVQFIVRNLLNVLKKKVKIYYFLIIQKIMLLLILLLKINIFLLEKKMNKNLLFNLIKKLFQIF